MPGEDVRGESGEGVRGCQGGCERVPGEDVRGFQGRM